MAILHRNKETTNLARMWTRHFLSTHHREDLVEIGEICISELVGNAIRHTVSPLVALTMHPNDGSPLFEVWDDSPTLPEFPKVVSFDDLEAESGRGLCLVKHLSRDCGTGPAAQDGKIVWFRL
ncbi:ATP-binding protein [Actinoallomurus iriomotensis]|nr:ATP-binding protein [Actinoallomurus iriomotensis]